MNTARALYRSNLGLPFSLPCSLIFSLFAGACAGTAPGEACVASSECESGLCYVNICLAPDGDADNDGLSNALEHKLGSDPFAADSDKDGKLDAQELGSAPFGPGSTAKDTDGDGRPDLVESLSSDADGDCIPDELDRDDSAPNADLELLKSIACSEAGVCAGHKALVGVTCKVGSGDAARCVYDAVPGWSAVESCDGEDNDCDGATDEDNVWQGIAVGDPCVGTGGCGAVQTAVVSCWQGKATCSANPDGAQPAVQPESCNGIDDDCDGQTDEVFAAGGLTVGAPCLGKGECGVGTVLCGGDGVPVCSTDVGGPDHPNKAEVCNQLDDDCDGQTDEGIDLLGLPLGATCTGIGACGEGVVVCGGSAAICSSAAGGPDSKASAESCNGVDDNCNGQTDEGLEFGGLQLGALCWGVGACGKGVVVCATSGKTTCSTLPDAPGSAATNEVCDGKDNDCDGSTDEGFLYQGAKLGAACNGVGACGVGTVQCSKAGAITCSSNPDGDQPAHKFEQCNNIDDDCDGKTDDEVPSSFGPNCASLGVCAGHKGVPMCTAGVWSCAFPTASAFEGPVELTCDGKDNDCDGDVDDGLPHVWASKTTVHAPLGPHPRTRPAWCATAKHLYVVGGALPGSSTLLPELWRAELATGAWQLLLTDPKLATERAALACLPGAKLWLIGGRGPDGQPQQGVQIDTVALTITSAPWSGTLHHRDDAHAVVDGAGKHVWLSGASATGKGPFVQRNERATGVWQAEQDVPSPYDMLPNPAKPADSLPMCADPSGDVWLLGNKFDVAKDAWAKVYDGLSGDGTLVCGASRFWLLGVANAKGAPMYRGLDRSTGKLLSADDLPLNGIGVRPPAALAAGHLFASDGAGLFDLGAESANTLASPAPVIAMPNPLPLQRWLLIGDVLHRVGRIPGTSGVPDRLRVWTLDGKKWQRFDDTPLKDQTGAATHVFADPDHDRLLTWLGGTHPPRAFGLTTHQWSDANIGKLTQLPSPTPTTLHATSHPNDRTWLMTSDGDVWQIDLLAEPSIKLLAAAKQTKPPAISADAVLTYDKVLGRLLVISATGALRVHALTVAQPTAWQLIGEDKTIASGRIRLIGDSTLTDALLLVGQEPNGPPIGARTVSLGAKAVFSGSKVDLGELRGAYEAVWQRNPGLGFIVRDRDATGLPLGRIDQLAWQCL